tara:strand:- start:1139 stop:1324 length:186 start_codon:yes stop_codon:yes gene_type:complete
MDMNMVNVLLSVPILVVKNIVKIALRRRNERVEVYREYASFEFGKKNTFREAKRNSQNIKP